MLLETMKTFMKKLDHVIVYSDKFKVGVTWVSEHLISLLMGKPWVWFCASLYSHRCQTAVWRWLGKLLA